MIGLFITFEGIEGCGKSTQIERLTKRLADTGRETTCLREPGGTPIGEAIREVVKHPPGDATISADAELLLMNASRAQLVQEAIRPALANGAVVLCDRFTTRRWPIRATVEDSTWARFSKPSIWPSATPNRI